MTDRAYTVKEIDDLRKACDYRLNFGTTNLGAGVHYGIRSWSPGEQEKAIEEHVRTYMLAGIVAEDLYKADRGETNLTHHHQGIGEET